MSKRLRGKLTADEMARFLEREMNDGVPVTVVEDCKLPHHTHYTSFTRVGVPEAGIASQQTGLCAPKISLCKVADAWKRYLAENPMVK